MKKTLYIILGCFSLGIGTIGAVLHVLYFTCGIKTLKTDKENDLESHN